MLQSRIVSAAARRSYRSLLLIRNQTRLPGFTEEPISTPPDDPAVPTGRPQEMKEKYEPDPLESPSEVGSDTAARTKPIDGTGPLTPPKPPHVPNPKLESVGVNNPADPFTLRKREFSSSNSNFKAEEISRAAKPTEEDNVEFYKHRKPSPLSNVEIADTRNPVSRATDSKGGADEEDHLLRAGGVVVWRPEQLETAEETMERARRIWLENAARGDPDSPHGRVLRTLRGEWF